MKSDHSFDASKIAALPKIPKKQAGIPPAIAPDQQAAFDALVVLSTKLSEEIIDINGLLGAVDAQSSSQIADLQEIRDNTEKMLEANGNVRSAVRTVSTTIGEAHQRVQVSTAVVRKTSAQSQEVAKWVQAVDARAKSAQIIVESVLVNNTQIASIAAQINMLAINAKIEAARAGETGKGFAVVAEAINMLSQKTGAAAQDITDNIAKFDKWISDLQEGSTVVGKQAGQFLQHSDQADISLSEIEKQMESAHASDCHERWQSMRRYGNIWPQLCQDQQSPAKIGTRPISSLQPLSKPN